MNRTYIITIRRETKMTQNNLGKHLFPVFFQFWPMSHLLTWRGQSQTERCFGFMLVDLLCYVHLDVQSVVPSCQCHLRVTGQQTPPPSSDSRSEVIMGEDEITLTEQACVLRHLGATVINVPSETQRLSV